MTEKTLLEQAKEELDAIAKELSQTRKDTTDTIKEHIKKIDDLAGQAAIRGEDLYEELGLKRRAKGAFIGAKIGLVGLKLAPITVPLAGIAGFLYPEQTADRFDRWLEKHRKHKTPDQP